MSREFAIARAERVDSGDLKRDLARPAAMPTQSQNSELAPRLCACSWSRQERASATLRNGAKECVREGLFQVLSLQQVNF